MRAVMDSSPPHLLIIAEIEKTPHDDYKQSQAQKLNNALYKGLYSLRQDESKELHLDMPAEDKRHGACAGYGDQLGEHHDVQ